MKWFFLILCFFFCSAHNSVAAEEGKIPETHIYTATGLGADIADWILSMNPRPNSIAILDVRSKNPLNANFSSVLETEVLQGLSKAEDIRVLSCFECRAARASVVGEQVVISKGVPSMEDFKKTAQKLGAEAFLLIEARRATTSIAASVEMYSGAGNVIGSRNFTQQVLDLDGGSAMLGFVAAVGETIGGKDVENGNPSGGADVFLLQELGGGRKGGVLIGAFGGNGGGAGYVMPTLGWLHRKSFLDLQGMAMVGLGPGGSNKGFGIAARASYQLFVGYCLFGMQAAAIAPLSSKEGKEAPDALIGFNIGIVFGR